MKELLKDGTMFMITYTPQTIGGQVNKDKRHITRRGKWDSKCKINSTYILYYDRDRSNYRYASNKLSPIHISVGLNQEEMKRIN
jgi:hypothetical protein